MIRLLVLTSLFALGFFSSRWQAETVSPPKETLSSYGFFIGPLAELKPAAGVIPYELNTPLFSNYAEKLRFIKLPEGTSFRYDSANIFDLPVGTVLIKNFYYWHDPRHPAKGKKIIETRLLIHEKDGWNALPYIWNEEQTEAYYDLAGDTRAISYLNAKGKKQTTNYVIPNKNQCKGCHTNGKEILPIGLRARHLNKTVETPDGPMNQLAYWAQQGWLTELPESGIPRNAKWDDPDEPLDRRARAYLDINCAHCHSAQGPANTSGLLLDISNQDPTALGVYKTPVAAGRGSGNLSYAIVPGKPEKSILVYRMNTTDPGIAMPELGREQIHSEGVVLISEWIRQMKQ
jgi:uncharacterized repeat protein (TIGR03806 family)